MKIKVISGGQCGADCAGLWAARRAGIPTGGWAPLGYLTENGPAAWLEELGIQEAPEPDYLSRTRCNIDMADALIWIGNAKSAGGKLTLRLARDKPIPFLGVTQDTTPTKIAGWITAQVTLASRREDKEGWVLLVAGNRESHNEGIAEWSEELLFKAFQLLSEEGKV